MFSRLFSHIPKGKMASEEGGFNKLFGVACQAFKRANEALINLKEATMVAAGEEQQQKQLIIGRSSFSHSYVQVATYL